MLTEQNHIEFNFLSNYLYISLTLNFFKGKNILQTIICSKKGQNTPPTILPWLQNCRTARLQDVYLDCRKGWRRERREPSVIVFLVSDTWLSCFETRPRIMVMRSAVGSLDPPCWESPGTSGQVWDYQMSPRIVSGGNRRISLSLKLQLVFLHFVPPCQAESWDRMKETNWGPVCSPHYRGRGSVNCSLQGLVGQMSPHMAWALSLSRVCHPIHLIKRIQPTI